jgi:hypothetical protein
MARFGQVADGYAEALSENGVLLSGGSLVRKRLVDWADGDEAIDPRGRHPIRAGWDKLRARAVPEVRAQTHDLLKGIEVVGRDDERPLGPAGGVAQPMLPVQVLVEHKTHRNGT